MYGRPDPTQRVTTVTIGGRTEIAAPADLGPPGRARPTSYPSSVSRIRLVVQADDLGMCRAVNAGIEHAVVDGIVTQTSAMAPTPWFEEGARIARRVGVATGLHATFTCEWDFLRWTPLSTGASLRRHDGTMFHTVDEAAAQISADDGVTELRVQAARARAAGLDLAYVDPHMGLSARAAYAAICADLGVRFMYPGIDPHHTFDSFLFLSLQWPDDLEGRPARLAEWLDQLGDGDHFLLSHPGVAGPELRALCRPDHPSAVWAETWRAADLAALTDAGVRAVIDRRAIELIDVTAL